MPTRARFKKLAQKFVDKTFKDFTASFLIESETSTPDTRGGETVTWSTFASVTGFVTPEKGSESQLDDRLNTNQSYRFSFEYVEGITAKMRVNYGGVIFNIRSVQSTKDKDIWINIFADRDMAT